MIESRPPWSKNQLNILGRSIRDDSALRSGGVTYTDVFNWYNELAVETARLIRSVGWQSVHEGHQPLVISRVKSIDTVREKLVRQRSLQLGNVQDIAGVRCEAAMSLDEQDAVVETIISTFGRERAERKDLRAEPKSGYRAVHVWLVLPAGRAEIQVRTLLQGKWANVYEEASDVFGRSIRYGYLPEQSWERGIVLKLQALSTVQIAQHEQEVNAIVKERGSDGVAGSPSSSPDGFAATIEERLVPYVAREKILERHLDELQDAFRRIQENNVT